MDAGIFGAFVQARRKALGMNQTQLAEKLHVTAKAVSRWERGVGFPSIELLQPLADALEISIVELMQSRILEGELSKETAEEIVKDTIDSIRVQEGRQRRKVYALFLLFPVLFGAQLFLLEIYSALGNSLSSKWTRFFFYEIIILGGAWGVRAVYYVIHNESSKLKDQKSVHKGMLRCLILTISALFLLFGYSLWRIGERLTGGVLAITGVLLLVVGYAYFFWGRDWE